MYKPKKYNSLSPYLIVDNAQKLVDLLKIIFGATEVRRFDHENGTIAHIELQLDDSILMISNTQYIFRQTVQCYIFMSQMFLKPSTWQSKMAAK